MCTRGLHIKRLVPTDQPIETMMKHIFLSALLLSACSPQTIIDTAYPDREKFAFRSADGEDVFTYTCASGPTDDATKKRARKAHAYLDARFTKAVNGAVDSIFDADGKTTARAVGKTLDKEIEDIVEQTEARYKCLFTDSRDA